MNREAHQCHTSAYIYSSHSALRHNSPQVMALSSWPSVAHFLRPPDSCSRHQRNQIRCQKAWKGTRRAHHAGGAEPSALPWFATKLSPTSTAHLADFPFLCCLINAELKNLPEKHSAQQHCQLLSALSKA